MYKNCYLCGQEGHERADCPNRVNSRRANVPVQATPASPSPGEWKKDPVFLRRPESQIADARQWADRIRASLVSGPHCADTRVREADYAPPKRIEVGVDPDIVTSEFRRSTGLHPAHECQLRKLAEHQAAESRALAGTTDPSIWVAAQALLTGPDLWANTEHRTEERIAS